MNIKIFAKLGGPFFDNDSLRIEMLKRASGNFSNIRNHYFSQLDGKLDEYTKLFIKGYGNDLDLLSCFRGLLFNSRELLDSLLKRLNKLTKNKTVASSRNFLNFANKLMAGDYDNLGLEIIQFLKLNITYLFHIRKIRNEIKNNIANIKFRFVTDHFEAYFEVPIENDEMGLIKYLDINNKEDALKNRSYHCTLILDKYFPEMLNFWETTFSILSK